MMTSVFYQHRESELLRFLQEKKFTQYIIIADANTNGFCVNQLKKILPELKLSSLIVIPQGEQNKTLEVCNLIWNELASLHAGSSSLIVNLGGGMVCDMGGFAASVYKRGISFMNIPTTLLAMTDAAYGGKTGIDMNGIKNLIGTFQPALAIYINPVFLNTLSQRILLSGIAETIKHCLLSSESWWHEMLSYELNDFLSLSTIQKSLQLKMNVVEVDEKDLGIRQTLNFGHTIGHAIESYSLQTSTPLLHGEAIMLGMHYELKLSEMLYQLPVPLAVQLESIKQKFFPSLNFQFSYSEIEPFLLHDKKNKKGIRMSLLKNIGECEIQVAISEQQIQEALQT